jgi:hypothetical protein
MHRLIAVWPKIRIASKTPIGQRWACCFTGLRTPGPRAIIAKSITVTVAPPFDGHDAGNRYRASGSDDYRADGSGHKASPRSRVDAQETEAASGLFRNLDVASDHGILIEANRGERQESVPKSAGAPEHVGLSAGCARDMGSPPLTPRVRAFALPWREALPYSSKTKALRIFGSARRGDRAQRFAAALQAKITLG